jgi:6-pyruvoyltetrahydropterin/6-carboxytetrahydropterin synthase
VFELRIKTRFAAAHQLRMVGEKCENLHGHNWNIEVYVIGETLDEAGVLMDFGIIKAHLAAVMDTLDHKYLNELDFFPDGVQPSSENIAVYVATQLQSLLKDHRVSVSRVTAWESENAAATYIVPQAACQNGRASSAVCSGAEKVVISPSITS